LKGPAVALGFYFNFGLGKLGDVGVSATKAVAGKEAVKAGANKVSESIIQGTTMTGGKMTEFLIEENKKR